MSILTIHILRLSVIVIYCKGTNLPSIFGIYFFRRPLGLMLLLLIYMPIVRATIWSPSDLVMSSTWERRIQSLFKRHSH
jgi:hypothetical protein